MAQEKYYLVLQKFINLILFGKLQNPNFSKDRSKIKMHNKLLDFFHVLDNLEEEHISETINVFYNQRLAEFRKKMSQDDSMDLMNCYGFSDFRVVSNLMRMLYKGEFKSAIEYQKKDEDLMVGLIRGDKFPDEIKAYLCVQFSDIFCHLPRKSPTISQKQYKALIDRYVCKYEYNKVLDIVHQS